MQTTFELFFAVTTTAPPPRREANMVGENCDQDKKKNGNQDPDSDSSEVSDNVLGRRRLRTWP